MQLTAADDDDVCVVTFELSSDDNDDVDVGSRRVIANVEESQRRSEAEALWK